jgi:carboxyl-terminal processing protease
MRKGSLALLGATTGVALTLFAAQPEFALFAAQPGLSTVPENYHRLDSFADALERVRKHYVERPDDNALIQAAINGMLSELEESSYVDPKHLNDTQVCTGVDCGNLGVDLTMDDGLVKIVSPLDDSPAAKAGLVAGDIVLRIDREGVQGLSFLDAVDKLRGRVNSAIQLTIVHPGQDQPSELMLMRDMVRVRAVRFHSEGGDIGYIRIAQLNTQTTDQMKKAIASISMQIPPDRLKGYVLDLRNNPNGLLEEAVAFADAFLDKGEIVSMRSRKTEEHFYATAGDVTNGKPIIVLINGGSASMAEVVAGALQDNKRATIVGTHSFGKASAYTMIPLGPGRGAIRLATGHYVTPLGHVIQGRGISPDVEAPQDIPDELKPSKGRLRPGLQSYIPPDARNDKALMAAYDLLRSASANASSLRDSFRIDKR